MGAMVVICRKKQRLRVKAPQRVIETFPISRLCYRDPPIRQDRERPRIEQPMVQCTKCKPVLNPIRPARSMPSDVCSFQGNVRALQAHSERAYRTPVPIGGQHVFRERRVTMPPTNMHEFCTRRFIELVYFGTMPVLIRLES